MKEPEKIRLNPESTQIKNVETIRLESNTNHLYDDFGYIFSIETKNENTEKSTET